MISEDKYLSLVENILKRKLNNNINQQDAVLARLNESLFVVAGPGSGKTTVIVLKILKYIFVDDVDPSKILVTTFTNKAANELKSRTVSWAEMIIKELGLEYKFNINDIIIGTIDSIAEDYVSKVIDVNVIDNFTSSAIMMQTLLTGERNNNKQLKLFFKRMKNNQGGFSTSDLNNQIQNIKERIMYDMLDIDKLKDSADKENILYEVILDYYNQLSQRNMFDYSLLERKFFDLLLDDKIDSLKDISVVLIDEYQDTNYLQEQIYFRLANYANENNGNVCIVGDDDQALYRFRGANIDLFTGFTSRIEKSLNIQPKVIFLQKNYRSTSNIIKFVNEYISIDSIYQKSRTTNKPHITYTESTPMGFPVFGMFRKNIEELSTDLSTFMYDLKTANTIKVFRNDKTYNINLGDNPSLAVLTNSPKEISSFNKKRLPYFIRETLQYKDEDLIVFNPRGQNIESTDIVSILCGLILITIDPNSKIQESIDNIPPHTKKTLRLWRKHAQTYLSENDLKVDVVEDNIDLNNVLNTISTQINDLKVENTENTIYHDIIRDTIMQTNEALNNDGYLTSNQIFWHILVPIATGAIQIDDDMFEFTLEDNVNIMSIHQSKGLEFDVVIVDVGSDIFNNQVNSAFKRFPKNGGISYNLEKYINTLADENYVNELSGRDEAFNDLIRRYFVAYTRAKSILVLVGLSSMKEGYMGDFQNSIKIQNVATGWSRDGKWHWENLDNLIHL